MASILDKSQKGNILSMLGIIGVQVQDDKLKEAEQNLDVLKDVIHNARKEMTGLELDEKITRFNLDQA